MRRSTLLFVATLVAAALIGCSSPADDHGEHQVAGPSFDCDKAESEAEKLVCGDPELAGLDRRLADEFQHALDAQGTDRAALQSVQRGWVSGRGECWKADDCIAACWSRTRPGWSS